MSNKRVVIAVFAAVNVRATLNVNNVTTRPRFVNQCAVIETRWSLLALFGGLSRLSDQGMVSMLGGSRPNPFCERAVAGLRTTFYIVMCDIISAWLGGVGFFRRRITP